MPRGHLAHHLVGDQFTVAGVAVPAKVAIEADDVDELTLSVGFHLFFLIAPKRNQLSSISSGQRGPYSIFFLFFIDGSGGIIEAELINFQFRD